MRILPLVAAAVLMAAPMAAQAAVVSFDGLPGANGSVFATYSEDGFTVSKTAGDAFVGQLYGNPLPSIFAGPYYGSASTSLQITAGGQTFSFQSWDFGANGGPANYSISGFLNNVNIFSSGGALSQGAIQTLLSGTNLVFDRLTFDLTSSGTSMNFDNFAGTISAVPEPATWAMMIIGFGAVGSMVRTSRRRNVFNAA
ncbi:MAG: PEPxxWA-CTERM sorting domain-containing protein [Phenylobacterium sp.]|uniref:PEPxxWA-CTERM sorting domain-containing protein n=1 Tax=Phenylobacterium sp. TaxID=1871053 RepID=UPI0027207B4B|nr:PEPxxWA-CTERM sorting domain-containing protein [Phenylobacterium sp.]MDO9432589.1 PEPxxWA-CTERM sorting domain-containing protein [Phenylobacterium sp.]